MKTLILFEDENGAHFFEEEGDLTDLNDVYINTLVPEERGLTQEQYEALQARLSGIIYTEGDDEKEIEEGDFSLDELEGPTKDWDHFIKCGFIA